MRTIKRKCGAVRAQSRALLVVLAAGSLLGGDFALRSSQATGQTLSAGDPWLGAQLDDLVTLYTHFHTHPELSRQEVETSRRIAEELKRDAAEVTTGVGQLGVVGVLKNGEGTVG